jgi:3-dehydroquinate dehydratase/shikimate dehydrogenase
VIANRTHERARHLATDFNCRCVEWAARHGVGCDVLVNCTPVGMHPDVDESPYDKNRLRASMVVFDTVYNPESTLLIKDARNQGCAVVTGVEMFVRQAAWQFYLFTGKPAPADVMRETMKRCIGAVRYGG